MDFTHKFVPAKDSAEEITLVLLHGTGGNEDDLIPLGEFLAPGAALLGVRGKVVEDGMPRFFRRLAEGVFDEEDLIARTHQLARFIEEAVVAYGRNPSKIVAVGYSNGANIAASMLLLEPAVLSSAVLLRAMVPLVPDTLPDLTGKHILMQCGTVDPLIPQAQSQRLQEMLASANADVTLEWAQTGHGLTNPEFVRARDWLHGVL